METMIEVVADDPIRQGVLAELNKVDAGIAQLSERYSGVVFDVQSTKGMDEAKKARLAIREPRYAVERIRKEQASRIRAAQLALNTEAERITFELRKIEDPIDAQIKAEEERKEREKQEAIRLEQERVAGIRAKIDAISAIALPSSTVTLSSQALTDLAAQTASTEILETDYQEFQAEALFLRDKVVTELNALAQVAAQREAEALRLAEEKRRLEEQQRELDEQRRQLEALRKQLAESEQAAKDAEAALARQKAEADRITAEKLAAEDRAARKAAAEQAAAEAAKAEPAVAQPEPSPAQQILSTSQEALFAEQIPSTEDVLHAVAMHFSLSLKGAERAILLAAEELSGVTQ